ncbi:acyl-CoA thioesterase [Salinibacterium sp. SYSU T00001]|uniref:acyl-CoA thioesterase n=1 Tax=Homoserinimonas sedimenticola TaxID=2986805 RepID=UPI0022369E60|nr:acyl-CoA thioesterase [Salinibacterium sedimenticola]MCW4386189.1 acyl-CoA thioesterase [Salinibacterium sedimenticola]
MPEVFEIVVPLRWADQDLNGHVNNVRVGTLLEEARVVWRRRAIREHGITSFEPGPLVASATTHYRRPIEYGPELSIRVGIAAIGTKSYTMSYVGVQEGEVVVEATTVMVAMDAGGASRALTKPEREYLARYLE